MIAARTELVDGSCHQLLAGAGFAVDQDGTVGWSNLLDGEANRLHRSTFAGQRPQIALDARLVTQIRPLALEALQLGYPRFQLGDADLALAAALAGKWPHAGMVASRENPSRARSAAE
jgi:hypothetical protein